jgi:uncharacterized membrane protein
MANEPASEYEETLKIDGATPEEIFAFVSDVENLPRYLPTTTNAEAQGPERVRVQGEAHGHRYDGDGWLKADPEAMRMEWGADEGHYGGSMEIKPDGDGTYVTVRLSFAAPPSASQARRPSPEDVKDGIRKGLESIRNQVTGDGGKVEPDAATDPKQVAPEVGAQT